MEGERIETFLDFTANHLGYVQFKLCPYPSATPRAEVTQACLDSHTLLIA